MRQLEIGPGRARLPGFETLDILPGPHVDRVADCRKLPYDSASFGLVYASHVIEHIPWYQTEALLADWVRVLASGGVLEVWTVNAYAIAKALVIYEETGDWTGARIGPWKDEWVQGDPYRWAAGRLICYSRSGKDGDPNWHRSIWTPKSLAAAFERAGLMNIREMDRSMVRGKDHGWFNLGVRGEKP